MKLERKGATASWLIILCYRKILICCDKALNFVTICKKTPVLWVLKCKPHRHLSETNGNLLLSWLPPWVSRGSWFQNYFTAIGSTSIFKRKQVLCGRNYSEYWGTDMFKGTRQHRYVQSACALCSAFKYRWRKNSDLFKVTLSMVLLVAVT